jgi:hydrogenase-4 component B
MLAPAGALALLCVAVGLAPFALGPALESAGATVLALPTGVLARPLRVASAVNLGVLALCAAAGAALAARLARGARASGPTWDCGYVAPAPTMQYSASSFAELLVRAFALALWPRVRAPRLIAALPAPSSFHSDVPDVVLDRVVLPATRGLALARRGLRVFQQGSIHAYLLYLWLALVALLIVTGARG